MTEAKYGESGARVQVWDGRVTVDCALVAEDLRYIGYNDERIVNDVRKRTPPEWWRRAAEVLAAENGPSTGGPLGLGVDWFADEAWQAVPDEVRQAIQDDAYEAAREVIVAGIDEHLGKLLPAVRAIRASGRSDSTDRGGE